jgi:hypothetical protein
MTALRLEESLFLGVRLELPSAVDGSVLQSRIGSSNGSEGNRFIICLSLPDGKMSPGMNLAAGSGIAGYLPARLPLSHNTTKIVEID